MQSQDSRGKLGHPIDRIGLFQPLTITQGVERAEPWTPAALCDALAKLELHALADAYTPKETQGDPK